MKKEFIIGIIIALLISVSLLIIPKHNLPTEEEWNNYMNSITHSGVSVEPVQGCIYCSSEQ